MANIEKIFDKLKEHHTYAHTGIMYGNCEKVSGSAGIDVDNFYYYPYEDNSKKIEICTSKNVHYGYAHIGEDGLLYDNSNRAIFRIV